jgi:hypothetical protein
MAELSMESQVASFLGAARRRLWCDRVLARLRWSALAALLLTVAVAATHVFVRAVPSVGLRTLLATLSMSALAVIGFSRPTLAVTSWWVDRRHGGMSWFSSWQEFGAAPPGRVNARAMQALRDRAAPALAAAQPALMRWRPTGVAWAVVCFAGCVASAWVIASVDGRAPADPARAPESAASLAMPDADVAFADPSDSRNAAGSANRETTAPSASAANRESGSADPRPIVPAAPGEALAGERRAMAAVAAAGGGEGRNAGVGVAAAADGSTLPAQDPPPISVRLRELRAALGGDDASAAASGEFALRRATESDLADIYDRQQQRLAQDVPAAAAAARPDDALDAPARGLMNRFTRSKALP